MSEIDVLRRGSLHQDQISKQEELSGLGTALAAHSLITYTLQVSAFWLDDRLSNSVAQVYNDRISRLSFDLGQSRHKTNAAMRKLVELVDACKMKDLETVSKLAVQVDIDSIASSYPELSPWQQQVITRFIYRLIEV